MFVDRNKTIFLFVGFIIFSSAFYEVSAKSNSTDESSDVLEAWMKLDKTLKGTAQSVIKYLMPMILESSGDVNLSSQCIQQSFQLITGLKSLKRWAFSFVDSSAKLSDGLLSGALSSFGEYDQCMETVVPHSKKKGEILFRGQYCMVQMRLPLPPRTKRYRLYDRLEELRNFTGTEVLKYLSERVHLMYYFPIQMGLCIPSGCTKEDLNNILSYAAGKINSDVKVIDCETAEKKVPLHGIQIFAIFFLCFLFGLVFVGTWIESHSNSESKNSKNLWYRILLSFSVISNFKRLVSTKSSMDNFRCLHGLRFFTIMWVVYGHAYLFPGMFATNYRTLFRITERAAAPIAQLVVNGSEAVDVFFFIAGMLVSYFTIQRIKIEKKSFNFAMFVLHRLCRIVPVVYFIILVSFLVPLTGSGPVFQELMNSTFNSCYQEWWKNVLFVNNFFYSPDMCLKQTWYVSCDIQLYLLSMLVIIPLIRSPKLGLILNSLIIIVSMVFTGIMTYIHDLAPSMVFTHMNNEDQHLFFVYSYANVLSRAGPYFVGVLTGYLLITKQGIKISKKTLTMGWILGTLSSGMIIMATAFWFNVRPPTSLEALLYSAVYKVAFTAGIAWVTFCCIHGHGGFINTLLSWKMWMPLSKLVFLTYLIEPMFQITYIGTFKSVQEFTHLHMVVQFFGFFCISMVLALVCNLLVESPFLCLEKIFFSSGSKREENKKEVDYKINGIGNEKHMDTALDMVVSENGIDNKCFTKL